MYDYFYGSQADQFSFYRIPKTLFTDSRFKNISVEAKVLYGLLLDRMGLSMKNGWFDDCGRVYIIFTIEEIKDAICCAEKKAVKLLFELEHNGGLIERKRQGLGKPNLIYVKNFSSGTQFKSCQNNNSGIVNITTQELSKEQRSNTEYKETEYNYTDSFLFTSFSRNDNRETKRSDAMVRDEYREIIKENIGYDALLIDLPLRVDVIGELLEIIVDVVCSNADTIRISGDNKPTAVVRSQFLKLDSEHIRLVLDGLKENTTRIKNIRQYLIASLYNATLTINNHYDALVRHDLSGGYL